MLQDSTNQRLVDYFTVSEAAKYLGVSPWTLRNWDRAGKLRPQRHPKNGYRIYRHADLEAVLALKGPPSAKGKQVALTDWNDIAESEHFVQFYESDAYLMNSVSGFMAGALDSGDSGIVIATPEHLEGIEQRLTEQGVDVIVARAQGRFVELDAAETLAKFMVDGSPDPRRFEQVIGGVVRLLLTQGRRLRAFGEMVALLWAEGNRSAAIRLEELWNELAKEQTFALFCAYPMHAFVSEEDGQPFGSVCTCHTRVIPAESYSTLTDSDERLRAISLLQQKANSLEAEIAHRKEVEEALRQREREFSDFFENALEGMHRVGPDGIILWANKAETRLLGYEPHEYIGHHISEFHADRAVIEDMLARLLRGESLREHPARLRCKDGSIKNVLINSNAYFEDGALIYTRCFTRDVTERKRAEDALRQSEARLRAMLQATPECIKIVASDGSLLYMSPAGMRMIECDGEFAGLRMTEFIAPEYHTLWRGNHDRVCAGESLTWEFEIVGRGGTHRWLETHAVPLPMPDGTTAHLGVTRDITSRKNHEAERDHLLEAERAARAEAERASRMKDEFLATLSHELRTPLNAILGWATILRSGGADQQDLFQGVETIERNARAQTQIIEDLLDMSRIISGKVRLDVQRIDVASVVQSALETARPAAEAKGIRLKGLADGVMAPVRGDQNRLLQIMWNLLSNAIKFTPKGGLIQVRLERVGSQIEMSVSDTGEGITPEFLPHVFDRFRQADASSTRRYGGLGLGLAIVKHLTELHGGSIRVESAGKGQGSTFTVSLPLTLARGELDSAIEPRQLEPAAPPVMPDMSGSIAGLKVLVVDDESDSRELVRRLLEDCDADVTTAASASEALEQTRAKRPDLIISDIGMPGEDGYSLIRKVRALGPDHGGSVPAIALTAYARSQDRMQSVLAGYQMHIPKPVEPAELITIVASLAGRAGA